MFGSKSLKIKGAKKKAQDLAKFKFKKGKENPLVEVTNHCEQYDRKNSKPDFSCCASCNEQEILRAIKTDDFKLLKDIIKSAENEPLISTAFP